MKRRYYILAALLGLAIGIAQFFYVYFASPNTREIIYRPRQSTSGITITCMAVDPGCGDCPGIVDGEYCIYNPGGDLEKRRGFPLYISNTGLSIYRGDTINTSVDTGIILYLNIIIWTLGLPLILYLLGRIINLIKRLFKKRQN